MARLERMERAEARGERVPRMEFATAHAALGDRDDALRYLMEAITAGEPAVLGIRLDPAWDPMRGDPAFRALARQVETIHFTRPRGARTPSPR